MVDPQIEIKKNRMYNLDLKIIQETYLELYVEHEVKMLHFWSGHLTFR